MRPDCCPKRIRRQMARPSHVEVYRESSGLSRKLCYSLMRSSNRGTMGITLQPSRQKLIIVQVMSEPVDPFGWNLEIAEGATVDRYLPLSTNLYTLRTMYKCLDDGSTVKLIEYHRGDRRIRFEKGYSRTEN